MRFDNIDLLRGFVMILMALDHVRYFFMNPDYSPVDLTQASSFLFLTRWITHFCAPIFIFLTGAAAFFYGSTQGRTRGELSRFLLTRGLWLIFLEVTLIHFGWSFSMSLPTLGVIWVIGCSMVLLSGFVRLPHRVLVGVALAMIFGHNLLDAGHALASVSAMAGELLGPLWIVLHGKGDLIVGGEKLAYLLYAIIPWVGVMSLGYGIAPFLRPDGTRKRLLWGSLAAIALFILLRGFNIYGNPDPWQSSEQGFFRDVLAILNTHKYPPSLSYLLMTLGPAGIALIYLDRIQGWGRRLLLVFGRVPLFYYVLHIFLIHLTATLIGVFSGFPLDALSGGKSAFPDDWGFGLPIVYVIWVMMIALLYQPTKWFMQLKARRKDWWLSYL